VTVCGGLRARLFRISFSGELAFELAVRARYGEAMMAELFEMDREFGAVAYGTEALGVLRIEKGHPAGNELNGQTTARDFGMGRIVSRKKDSIGAVLSRREGLSRTDGLTLVGLRPLDPAATPSAGAHLLARGAPAEAANDEGWLSSVAYSPHMECVIALAFLRRGSERLGEVMRAVNLLAGEDVEMRVVPPDFIDPDGSRLRT